MDIKMLILEVTFVFLGSVHKVSGNIEGSLVEEAGTTGAINGAFTEELVRTVSVVGTREIGPDSTEWDSSEEGGEYTEREDVDYNEEGDQFSAPGTDRETTAEDADDEAAYIDDVAAADRNTGVMDREIAAADGNAIDTDISAANWNTGTKNKNIAAADWNAMDRDVADAEAGAMNEDDDTNDERDAESSEDDSEMEESREIDSEESGLGTRISNLFPRIKLPARDVDVEYMLYTQDHRETPEFISTEDLGCRFLNGIRTVFVIHGFTQDGYAYWVQALKDELLKVKNLNVIIVNWRKGATWISWDVYVSAADNTRIVGRKTAELIQAINNQMDVAPSDIHMIGHSLGAHCCGFTGKHVKELMGERIGRISALDPAGFLFANNGPDERLHRTDASFTDVIHTDAGTLLRGLHFGWFKRFPFGHVDFYPNGGSDQPNCPQSTLDVFCSHMRSTTLYINSIRTCTYPTRNLVQCPAGPNTGVNMGYYTDPQSRGRYCLETSDKYPYCVSQLYKQCGLPEKPQKYFKLCGLSKKECGVDKAKVRSPTLISMRTF